MKVGVCYYPEHWPESRWEQDAQHMKELGLSMVRIGEFAWSKLEPTRGDYQFDWLERSINILHKAGLEVILGTPTATPPAWLIRNNPDMLAVDEHGRVRDFGSRRHYCFSSQNYRTECACIVSKLAERFGNHPGVVSWQTDNEYGCHSTSISYSPAALNAFHNWCSENYESIEALNEAWGNVFWSMEYTNFEEIGLPVGTVTESNPAHRLAYWRFSSEQIKTFNQLQVEILRRLSPGRDIVHNFMGNFVEFDHFDVSEDLDVASWDNYPLGFLTRDGTNDTDQKNYLRTGHPDSSAFHHDLYRACGTGRMWLMEQQPGPVNWAPYNPAPLSGMVRLWGWEAIAHGAELVSYFRYRQAPKGQEQMHTALCLPNGDEDDAAKEVKELTKEIQRIKEIPHTKSHAQVALLFDYVGDQSARIQQPDGRNYDPLVFIQTVYSVLRQLGIQVDIVPTNGDLSGYSMIVLANCTESDHELARSLALAQKDSQAHIIMFPRTGSKTDECAIPENLAPGAFQSLIPISVTRSETLPEGVEVCTNKNHTVIDWRERIDAAFEPEATFDDGWGFHYKQGRVHYFNGCPNRDTLLSLFFERLEDAKLAPVNLGAGLRIAQRGDLTWAFNYGPEPATLPEPIVARYQLQKPERFFLGEKTLQVGDIALWGA